MVIWGPFNYYPSQSTLSLRLFRSLKRYSDLKYTFIKNVHLSIQVSSVLMMAKRGLKNHLLYLKSGVYDVLLLSNSDSFHIRSFARFRFSSIEFWNLIDLSIFVLIYVLIWVKQFLASCASFIVLSMWLMDCWKLGPFMYAINTLKVLTASSP